MQTSQSVYLDSRASIDERVQDLMSQMTLSEKVGQMTLIEKNSISPDDVIAYAIGSILSGGGGNPDPNNATTWRTMVQEYIQASLKSRLGIPILYGADAVHGHNNVKGATIFPHNIGLGASRDADLVKRIASVTAHAVLATNVHWNYAPAVCVPQDIRWGRTYEGFSENTDLVSELGVAYVQGLQKPNDKGEWVLASVKHFAGDGGTEWDSISTGLNTATSGNNWQAANSNWRIDQGDTRLDETTLRRVHLAPYKEAIETGALNIMISHSGWNGLKLHAHEYLLTQVLKGEWGFEGFLVSDWMALSNMSDDAYQNVVTAINAGLDMIMVPYDYKSFIGDLTKAVNQGDVTIERIDDAVERILRVKFLLGLFENALVDDSYLEVIGSSTHRALAREAVHKSAVLLKNEQNVLPISKTKQIAVVGIPADDIGLACGGWTIEWQGNEGAITEGATLLDGLKSQFGDEVIYSSDGHLEHNVNTAVVVVAENPYAEGEGDRPDLTLSEEDTALIERIRPQCDNLVLVIYSGRPIVITHIVKQCDAIVAAWLPGSEADALADLLVGDVPFTAKLPFTWIKSMNQVPLSTLQSSDEEPLWHYDEGIVT